jgi:hypothetical protein
LTEEPDRIGKMGKKSCSDKIKSYDGFGAPIGVTFKGENVYKTTCGGVVSILLLVLLGLQLTTEVLKLHIGR